jgi:hypothetical protein
MERVNHQLTDSTSSSKGEKSLYSADYCKGNDALTTGCSCCTDSAARATDLAFSPGDSWLNCSSSYRVIWKISEAACDTAIISS